MLAEMTGANEKYTVKRYTNVYIATIHRYVNYFEIQVLIILIETETSTSTLHHNKFTYLDYVCLLPSYCQGE